MRNLYLFALLLIVPFFGNAQSIVSNFTVKAISFPSKDGLEITADLYKAHPDSAPFILLFHQAGYSRGSYREIAPKLNALGFNCIAIDQRSGNKVNGIVNQTHLLAEKEGKKTAYIDALQDLESAFDYVQKNIKPKKTILWGSSYSATLVLYLGNEYKNQVNGILSFSPGEYFKINGKKIAQYTSGITCPVFITSAKNEKKSWQPMYDRIQSKKNFFLPQLKGFHGSKALWEKSAGNQEYWKAVKKFLEQVK